MCAGFIWRELQPGLQHSSSLLRSMRTGTAVILRIAVWLPEEEGHILGWTALSATSSRPVYRGVVEVSLYVGADSRGRGVGKALMLELIARSEAKGYWTLMSSVFAENAASRALHKACGFREVGYREKIAVAADGKWHDTILIERRSPFIR